MEIGIYKSEELEGDLRRRIEGLHVWMMSQMDEDTLRKICNVHGRQVHFDEALQGWMRFAHAELQEVTTARDAAMAEERRMTTERNEAKLQEAANEVWCTEAEEFLKDILVELPLEFFDRGKSLLKLGAQEGPKRPYGADDAFRDAMEHLKQAMGENAQHPDDRTLKRAAIYARVMDAVARKQHAEAVEAATKHGSTLMKMAEEIGARKCSGTPRSRRVPSRSSSVLGRSSGTVVAGTPPRCSSRGRLPS